MRVRADVALVEGGHFESRAKAREAIEAGLVTADGVVVTKASATIGPNAAIVATAPYPWVSRGGVKLAAALDHFGVEVAGRQCLDIGASTGGFAQVLLTRGAAHVTAVDVGHGQLHPSLAADARLTSLEGTDARNLRADLFTQAPSFLTFDVSFISLRLVLPHVCTLADISADLVALIKPQFEAGPGRVKRGVVRDAAIHDEVCAAIRATIEALGWQVGGIIPSPIAGGDGNLEFLIGARR